MSLRRKLLLALLIPALLIGLVGGVGVWSVDHLEEAAGRILSENYRSIQEVRRMERALRQLDLLAMADACGGHGQDATERRRLAEAFEVALRASERNITEAGEQVALARIRQLWTGLRPRLLAPGDALAPPPPVTHLLEAIERLAMLNERAMFAEEARTRDVAELMVASVAGFLAAALVALAVFALLSANRIARPVSLVADRLHQALNPEGPAEEPRTGAERPLDEIARLRAELEALLARLQRYEDEQNRRLVHLQGRLALVMDEVREGLVLLDDRFRIVTLNRVGRHLLGADGGAGRRLDDLPVPQALKETLAPILEGAPRAERELSEVTLEVAGAPRVYRPRLLPLVGAADEVEGYLLVLWDVTEQREMEESRRRFISMLSHELKTPMTSLALSVGMLREQLTELAAPQQELLAIAGENCASLSRLVGELIDAARDATPDLALRPRRIDLARLIRYALRPLQPQAAEKAVELMLPDERARVFTDVDPVKFPWIVTNIVGNAIRYTPRGGRIEVSIGERSDGIELTVHDSGRGIPREELSRIFEPWVSLDAEPRSGTHGLGLAIAREIVEAHGGTITAESEIGAGTTFRIRLPRSGEIA